MSTERLRRRFPRLYAVLQALIPLYRSHRETLLLIWDIFMFSVVGLNSFILLLHRSQVHRGLLYVICAGALAYWSVLSIQTILLVKRKHRRKTLIATKRVFRLVYTAIYLTAILLDIFQWAGTAGRERDLARSGLLFLWVTLWGTNFLWVHRIFRFVQQALPRARGAAGPPNVRRPANRSIAGTAAAVDDTSAAGTCGLCDVRDRGEAPTGQQPSASAAQPPVRRWT